MRGRRYPQQVGGGELFPELVDVLLEGWSVPERPSNPDPFRIFSLSDDDMADIWRRHRVYLMREARRRGVSEPFGLRFDIKGVQ